MYTSKQPMIIPSKRAWNNGRIIGQKRPLLLKHVWGIRVRLELAGAVRERVSVLQSKTQTPVRFEITEGKRKSAGGSFFST